ncbi:MAG: MotA/TolQ/ExbB proton channel family protein [Thermaurantiacus sp.]
MGVGSFGAGSARAETVGGAGVMGQIAGLIELGGPIVMILLAVSVIALAIIAVKLVQFARAGVWSGGFIDEVTAMLHRGDYPSATERLATEKGPVAVVMRAAVAGRLAGASDSLVREEVERIAGAQIDVLEKGLPQLALIATISPLLGLFGTVTGLIQSFQQLADAGDRVDPAILSGGIWEALLTTVVGLAVAIPAATAFTLLQRTVDLAARRMEDAATRVFTIDLYDASKRQRSAPAETDGQQARRTAGPASLRPAPAE